MTGPDLRGALRAHRHTDHRIGAAWLPAKRSLAVKSGAAENILVLVTSQKRGTIKDVQRWGKRLD